MSLGVKGTTERNKKNRSPVSKKISHLIHEGTPDGHGQAGAMALSMQRAGRLTKEGGYRRVKK